MRVQDGCRFTTFLFSKRQESSNAAIFVVLSSEGQAQAEVVVAVRRRVVVAVSRTAVPRVVVPAAAAVHAV